MKTPYKKVKTKLRLCVVKLWLFSGFENCLKTTPIWHDLDTLPYSELVRLSESCEEYVADESWLSEYQE